MTPNQTADSTRGAAETPMSHLELLKATYGIGDSFTLQNMLFALFTGLVLGGVLAIAVMATDMTDKPMVYPICLMAAFNIIGMHIVQTAAFKSQMKVMCLSMGGSAWKANVFLVLVNIAVATAAAAVAVQVGGILGFFAGIGVMIINPVTRLVPSVIFELRIWQAKRNDAKYAANEGVGG